MVKEAKAFATKAHKGQYRKGTDRPYIVHPSEVAQIVTSLTTDVEIIAAAWLHDTLEDCPEVTPSIIEEQFGKRVASIVIHESEDKTKSWKERKSSTIKRLKESSLEVQYIALADKLSNMRDIDRDYLTHGENLWERFRMKDKAMIGWYYKEVRESLRTDLEYTDAFQEYTRLVDKNFS